jgi:hypothetical protein
MTTKTSILVVILVSFSIASKAQLRFAFNGSSSSNLKSKVDSTSVANKNGTAFSINAAYAWGRLSLGSKLQLSNHTAAPVDDLQRLALVSPSTISELKNGGGLKTTSFLLGPELCMCYKKLRFLPTYKIGVVQSKADSSTLEIRGTPQVGNKQYKINQHNATNLIQETGFTLGYKVSNHISINSSALFSWFKTKYIINDYRNISTTNALGVKTVQQQYQFLQLGGGIAYHF